MPPIGKYNKLSVFVHQFNSTLTPGLVGESRLWFEHFSTKDKNVVDLLGVVMAAREPLSSAHLDLLGLLGARQGERYFVYRLDPPLSYPNL